jgi:hypothetical protein
VSERLTCPAPPAPLADRLRQAALALWEGLDAAIDTEFAGGDEQQISARIPAGEVRRAIASAAAAYRVSGMGEPEAGSRASASHCAGAAGGP